MIEKFRSQIKLEEKLIAIDHDDVAKRILEAHVIPDILGNLRSYLRQPFQCKKENRSFRRQTASGKCPECGSPLKPTVAYKSVVKYVPILMYLYDHVKDEYLGNRIRVLLSNLKDTFGKLDISEAEGIISRDEEEMHELFFRYALHRL